MKGSLTNRAGDFGIVGSPIIDASLAAFLQGLEVHKAKAYSIALGVSAPNWYGKRFSPKLYEERVGRINLRVTRHGHHIRI
jgi:hypothetical protein